MLLPPKYVYGYCLCYWAGELLYPCMLVYICPHEPIIYVLCFVCCRGG